MTYSAENDARITELEKYVQQLERAAALWKSERDEAERQWKEWQEVAERIAAEAEAKIVALRADLCAALPSVENDVCRCVPDDEVTARDADTGEPLEYVRVPGFWGWFRSGWQEVACPVHDGHASPFSCSRCNPLDCVCGCHRPIPPTKGGDQ